MSDDGECCIHCGDRLGDCDCPLEQGQFHPDNPVGEKPKKLQGDGCARQIYDWLNGGTYRIIMHRHNDTFRAVDDSDKLYVEADTLPALADYLQGWPEGSEVKTL